MPSCYRPDEATRRRRSALGALGAAATLAFVAVALAVDAPPWVLFATVVPLFAATERRLRAALGVREATCWPTVGGAEAHRRVRRARTYAALAAASGAGAIAFVGTLL